MNRMKVITILLVTTIAVLVFTITYNYKNETDVDHHEVTGHSHSTLRVKTRELTFHPPAHLDTNRISIEEVRDQWNKAIHHPVEWGEHVTGVKNRLDTDDKVMALTFDACGGPLGSGYDDELISFLRSEGIPATIFVNARWINENEGLFIELATDNLFAIENHGTEHLPLSINGGTAWGINGTTSVDEVIDEVMGNQSLILELTGKEPSFFRSGTAFYDDVAVQIVEDLGLQTVNFNILGDAGATYNSTQVKDALLKATPGSIALLHMNHPSSGTAAGVKEAVPLLREDGYDFVHLTDYNLKQ